jgi:uncharacterized protein (TIGR00369 family)
MGNNETPEPISDLERCERATRFISVLRHCQVLGISLVSADADGLVMKLPYAPELIGNPVTGALHGGSLTTLMDTACGTAVVNALPGFELCPTLDLRVDYMRSARSGQNLLAYASIQRVTSTVVFADCRVMQENDGELIAKCCATFMRLTHLQPASTLASGVRGGSL